MSPRQILECLERGGEPAERRPFSFHHDCFEQSLPGIGDNGPEQRVLRAGVIAHRPTREAGCRADAFFRHRVKSEIGASRVG